MVLMITNDYQSDMPPFLLPMADKAPNQAHRDAEDDGSRDASRLSGALQMVKKWWSLPAKIWISRAKVWILPRILW